jgi:AcrR family transcriptional regulator
VRTEAKGPAGRGRPADPGIERRVLAAALTVYGEVGWAGFTLDRVARRAPVGKAALYRRWPTKEDLLLAALEHLAEPPGDEADPTDLRGCLIGMTEQVIDMFVGPKALVLPRVLIEASQYPPRFDDMVQNIVRARFGTVRTVIQAAAERGELPARTPPDLIIDAIMGRVISLIVLTPGARRATINAERDRYAASVTDFVLGAIARLARAAARAINGQPVTGVGYTEINPPGQAGAGRQCRQRAMDSVSSWSPQAYAQPPPPLAQAPKPTRVSSMSVQPPRGNGRRSAGRDKKGG